MVVSKTLSVFLLLLVLMASAMPMNSKSTRALVSDVETKNPTLTSSTIKLAARRVCPPCEEAECSVIDPPRAGRSWSIDFSGVRVVIAVSTRGRVNIVVMQLSPAYDLWVIAINDQSIGIVESLGDRGQAGTSYTFPGRRLPAVLEVTMYPPRC